MLFRQRVTSLVEVFIDQLPEGLSLNPSSAGVTVTVKSDEAREVVAQFASLCDAAEVVLRAYPVGKAGKVALVSGVALVVTAEVN